MNNDVVRLANGDFEVRPLPEANSHVEQIRTNYGKTPAKGAIEGEAPRAQTQEETQESWARAKNIKPAPRKKD